MKIIISENILLESKRYATVNIDKILASERGLKKTLYDLYSNRFSQTNKPLDVWVMDGELQLTDGYHRFAQYLIQGIKKVRVKISSGYTDYYAKTYPEDKFEVQPTFKYGGMEIFADDEILEDIRLKLDGEK